MEKGKQNYPYPKRKTNNTLNGKRIVVTNISGNSEQTIKTQKRNLCHKLGVITMQEAIRLAINNGLL